MFSFILSYPDRNLLLRAINLSDMTKWIRALEYQADIVRGGCGTSVITDSNTSCCSPQGKGRSVKEKYKPPTLEANLEATMLRLETLEKDIKGASQSSRRMPDGKRDIDRSNQEMKNGDTDKWNSESGSESKNDDLRRGDVHLYDKRDRVREKKESRKSSPKNKRFSEDKVQTDSEVEEVAADAVRGKGKGWKPDSPENYNRKNVHRNDHSNNGYDRNDKMKKNYHNAEERDEDDNFRFDSGDGGKSRNKYYPDIQESRISGPGPGSTYNVEHQRSSSSRYAEGRCSKSKDTGGYGYGDDSSEVEEVAMPATGTGTSSKRSHQRIRSQVQGHRDPDGGDRNRKSDRLRGRSNGDGKSSSDMPPLGNSSWGYDDDMYGGARREGESFEGCVSNKESRALHAAGGRAAGRGPSRASASVSRTDSVPSDSGGSGTNSFRSYRSIDYDDGPGLNDVPDMDLTVRRVPQRGNARERRQDRYTTVQSFVRTHLCIYGRF